MHRGVEVGHVPHRQAWPEHLALTILCVPDLDCLSMLGLDCLMNGFDCLICGLTVSYAVLTVLCVAYDLGSGEVHRGVEVGHAASERTGNNKK